MLIEGFAAAMDREAFRLGAKLKRPIPLLRSRLDRERLLQESADNGRARHHNPNGVAAAWPRLR